MNFNFKRNPVPLQVLLGCLLCVFLAGLFYVITFRRPSVLGMEALSRANGTRTAIALTSRALYGPFATPTGPSATITNTPTVTPTITVTPSNTPSPTPFRFFVDTATPRTPKPNTDRTRVPVFTSTSVPRAQPTEPPPQPTQSPPQATQPPPAPQPTSPPAEPTKKVCLNPQGHPIPCH